MNRIREELDKCQNPLGVLWGYPPIPKDLNNPPDPQVIEDLQARPASEDGDEAPPLPPG